VTYTPGEVSREDQEAIANWLIVAGAAALFGSLFLTWSHQFTPRFVSEFAAFGATGGVPDDPTGWQVYAAADVILTMLAAGLALSAFFGSHAVRVGAIVAALAGLAFVVHALSAPPTNGLLLLNPAQNALTYAPVAPTAGPGETVAILALVAAVSGLLLSLRADRRARPAPSPVVRPPSRGVAPS
jgi:hypothetical protein